MSAKKASRGVKAAMPAVRAPLLGVDVCWCVCAGTSAVQALLSGGGRCSWGCWPAVLLPVLVVLLEVGVDVLGLRCVWFGAAGG